MEPLRIGVVGCGNISDIYMTNAPMFRGLRMVACADIRPEAAGARAEQHGLRAMTVDALIASDVDLVLNLSVPAAHQEVSLQAIRAGKHVFTEKPLCATGVEARVLLDEAARAGLQVGSAPDTFLGAAGRRARALIDGGALGTVVTGTAFMMGRGMEHWHPSPAFYYDVGAGPVLDMGPYYVTMLLSLLGPVAAVTAAATIGTPLRTITAEGPLKNTTFPAKTPTTALSVLEFRSGAILSFGASWDVHRHSIPPIELHGTEGSLRLPDPDFFGGGVALSRGGAAWKEHPSDAAPFGAINYPAAAPDRANYRCLGLAEMADAIRCGRPPRAGGALAFHVLEVLEAVLSSAARGTRVEIASRPGRPAPLDEAAARELLA